MEKSSVADEITVRFRLWESHRRVASPFMRRPVYLRQEIYEIFEKMPKRRGQDEDAGGEATTPRKTRRSSAREGSEIDSPSRPDETPSARKSILKGTPNKANGTASIEPTPKSLRKVLFSTPNRAAGVEQTAGEKTPTATRNDRSARRKSTRALQRPQRDADSEDEELGQDAELAREILGEEGDGSDEDVADEIPVAAAPSGEDTPSKRGRPKGRRRERTPSPPPDLPPHELYFFQNRAGANRTSANTLSSHLLHHHEDYFVHMDAYKDPHASDVARLQALHRRVFDQWMFELEERFNLCLYGYGSKRQLVMEFAEHMHTHSNGKTKIVVVNGYTPGLTLKDVLTTLASAVVGKTVKLPAQPALMLDLLLQHMEEHPPSTAIQLIIHSLDHQNLRKQQSLIARLAASQHLRLLATVDNPNFPLLWDTSLLRQFHWLYHDATTFQPYTAETDVVDSVNELLGRSGRRLGGKDGVAFVLKSLPENAKALFRILVAEQLANDPSDAQSLPITNRATASDDDDESLLGASDDERAAEQQNTPSRRGRKPGSKSKLKARSRPPVANVPEGVEYRTLYHKAVEEFVCTSELNFRTLLKEFYDHQMVESRKDGLGTERLSVPFGKEELEGILQEIV